MWQLSTEVTYGRPVDDITPKPHKKRNMFLFLFNAFRNITLLLFYPYLP